MRHFSLLCAQHRSSCHQQAIRLRADLQDFGTAETRILCASLDQVTNQSGWILMTLHPPSLRPFYFQNAAHLFRGSIMETIPWAPLP